MKEGEWTIMCGHCDETTKKPTAGVGIAVRKCHKNSIKIIPTKILTEGFKDIYEAGRAAKYQIDMGWNQHLMIFILYGYTGDSGEAKIGTNAVIDAIHGEIDRATYLPTVLMGDFNAEPESIEAVQEMIDEEA